MHLTLPVRKLADYGTTVLSPQAILSTVTTLPVEGGYASAKVFRHDLEFHVTDNDTRTLSVIQKYTNSQEVCIMHTISEVPGKQTFPEIIDSNPSQGGHEKECGNWFITPFYEGTTLTFEDEMPLPVVESLARLHAYFAPRLNQLEWLWRMTTDTLKEMFKKTLESLNAARIRKPDSKLTSIYNQVEKASNNQLVYTVLERLPVTLTHGDVHPGNIIDVREGTPVLLDWGNARIAPATSDLANIVNIDSPNWLAYLAAWESVTGKALNREMTRAGYHWATIMINLQYLPFCIGHWPNNEGILDHISMMMEHIQNAIKHIKVSGMV